MAASNRPSTKTITQVSTNSTRYNDMFDTIDDTNDGLQFSLDTLNQYFLSGQMPTLIYQEEKIENDILQDPYAVEIMDDRQNEPDEETFISQKLSQLSTTHNMEIDPSTMLEKKRRCSATTSPSVTTKKMKKHDNDSDDDNDLNETDTKKDPIPNYLSMHQKAFVSMAQSIIKDVQSITINDIQQLAFFIHQMHALRIKKQITTVYLQSVTGTLPQPECDLITVDRRVIPMQVKSFLLSEESLSTVATAAAAAAAAPPPPPPPPTTTTMDVYQPDQESVCEKRLNERIQELCEEIQYYEQQMIEKQNSLTGFTLGMNEIIQIFIQEYGIKPLELKYQLKKTLITYDYELEILERKYIQEKPNEYQIQIAKRLSNTKRDVEKSKRALLELKQGVFFNKSSISFDSIPALMTTSNDTSLNNEKSRQQLFNKYENELRCRKLDLLSRQVPQAEQTYYRLQEKFDYELSSMWKNHRNLVKDQGMMTSLINLLEQRLNNLTNRWRDIYNYRVDYFLQNAYDELDHMNNDEISEYVKIMGPSSSIIIHATHKLNQKQLQLLSRGPSYVSPCLMYTSLSNESMDEIVKKQFVPLKHQINNLFLKNKINLNLQMEIQKKIYDLFKNLFSKSIPSNLYQRAIYETNLIQSIQTSLKKNNLILRRTADNMNIFYLGNLQEFETKADQYLARSEDYDIVFNVNDVNNEKPLNVALNEMIESMNSLLQQLKIHRAISQDLYERFIADPNKVKLPYLYFLPAISNEKCMSLVPIVTGQYSATWKIAKYLNQLLRPFADGILRSTTFAEETDFIQQLNRYATTERRLRPTTLFCSIKITNFYTLDEHQNMIDTVGYFLQDHLVNNKLESLTVQTIRNLLHLFLYNNIFSYKDGIFKFTRGSPNTVPLTETLSNIYLFVWQKKLLKEVNQNIELFGRYKDEIFFTWNKSTALELETFIEDIREKNRNVRFQKIIGTSVSFLNAYIENRQGQLYTRLHYDTNMPRYTLPYVTGHSKSSYSNWLFHALIRAVCYCTLVDDFQQARIYLELTYLINGYSVLFVETHVKRFFNYFNSQTMRYSYNQNIYDKFRQEWFKFVQQRDELSEELQKLDDTNCLFQFHYIYDFGPKCRFNREFHQLWRQYFQQHPTLSEEKCKIILNFGQAEADFTANRKTDMAREVEEYRQEQEKASQKQVNQVQSQAVQEKKDAITDDSIRNSNDENEMTSLLIVDLPWSQTSQHNAANDD
ncbi:unnamed protein product [Rotaria sp. Silwood2]|nr:unnamed protein product [Rotaria sp. Silwood2]CAF3196044.1 unnamed protein product [Rotaria sp. Silwood2]CAF4064027.1 unnamed protein product [Rotaria sp. Silwood2]CAF4237796.1 unnamed protein product [Rotaria sp. Silwood2]